MKIAEPLVIGYSRDSKGKIVGRHLKPISNTLHVANFNTTAQYLFEPTVLHMERTEEEKIRRREHGDNGAKFSASKQLTTRIDGLSNAITTAQKDNLLCCPETDTLMRVRKMVKDKRKDLAKPFLYAKDLFIQVPKIDFEFDEKEILVGEIADRKGREIPKGMLAFWHNRQEGDKDISCASVRETGRLTMFNNSYIYNDKICPTLTAREDCLIHFDTPRYLSTAEVNKISSFPSDYDYQCQKPHYVCGMSVPPVMMAQVASRVYEQWLSKLI